MSDTNDRAAEFEADLIRKVSSCGVDAAHISLRYEGYLQDYDLVVGSGPLSPECISGIDDVVGKAAVLSFTDPANAAELGRVRNHKWRLMAREHASAMPGLPVYDPARMNLAEFAREIEVFCGVEPGGVLEVINDMLTVRRSRMPMTPEELRARGRVVQLAGLALAGHSEVHFGIVGGT